MLNKIRWNYNDESKVISSRTCSDEFNLKFLYAIVLENDLLNLLNFLFLRADNYAQYEIRVYAETMLETVKKWVPITHAAFLDYRVGAVHVSAKGKKVIKMMAKGEKVTYENSGLSKREWNELMTSFDFIENIV